MAKRAKTDELSLADMAEIWRQDLFHNVIPFWAKHSLDREHGGYFTCLDREGAILDDSKYMWLQAFPSNASPGLSGARARLKLH